MPWITEEANLLVSEYIQLIPYRIQTPQSRKEMGT